MISPDQIFLLFRVEKYFLEKNKTNKPSHEKEKTKNLTKFDKPVLVKSSFINFNSSIVHVVKINKQKSSSVQCPLENFNL
ncbi:hypothetical protein BpHYR1_052052 [Brachionus plicatilis]|uniref:Uncharacterized protein n=1 Tax=Brachionus plicatilis TaxID=10195 RepID=A0A3M7RHD3_BRAPC|nr:hypothetical protein BpHYR1_052052 [Brachionus plicatilis]